MTEAGSGEYYYNFTVPSNAGTYTVTSTFSCGLNSDFNSTGSFIVEAADDVGDDEPDDGPSDGPSGGPGGGPSGGGDGGVTREIIETQVKSYEANVEEIEWLKILEHGHFFYSYPVISQYQSPIRNWNEYSELQKKL